MSSPIGCAGDFALILLSAFDASRAMSPISCAVNLALILLSAFDASRAMSPIGGVGDLALILLSALTPSCLLFFYSHVTPLTFQSELVAGVEESV